MANRIQDFPGASGQHRDFLEWLDRLDTKARRMALARNIADHTTILSNLISEYSRYITLEEGTPSEIVTHLGATVTNAGTPVTHTV